MRSSNPGVERLPRHRATRDPDIQISGDLRALAIAASTSEKK